MRETSASPSSYRTTPSACEEEHPPPPPSQHPLTWRQRWRPRERREVRNNHRSRFTDCRSSVGAFIRSIPRFYTTNTPFYRRILLANRKTIKKGGFAFKQGAQHQFALKSGTASLSVLSQLEENIIAINSLSRRKQIAYNL